MAPGSGEGTHAMGSLFVAEHLDCSCPHESIVRGSVVVVVLGLRCDPVDCPDIDIDR